MCIILATLVAPKYGRSEQNVNSSHSLGSLPKIESPKNDSGRLSRSGSATAGTTGPNPLPDKFAAITFNHVASTLEPVR